MTTEPWTIRRTLAWTTDYLAQKGDEHPRLSAEWLLSNATSLSRVELYTNFDKPLVQAELDRMHEGIKRRAQGEPLQYVTGEMPFRHIVLGCEKNVLIPRPETEVLVDEAMSALALQKRGACVDDVGECGQLEGSSQQQLILEVGTGTGCIALSLAQELPDVHIIATDISEDAIALSTRNREALGLTDSVDFLLTDLAEGIELHHQFDLVISNPPYIPTDVVATLPHEVEGYEPHLALDGGADGLDIFRRLVDCAEAALAEGGVFAVELFEKSLDDAADILRARGCWENIAIKQDLTRRPRILIATRGRDER